MMVIMERLKAQMEMHLSEELAGFRRDIFTFVTVQLETKLFGGCFQMSEVLQLAIYASTNPRTSSDNRDSSISMNATQK